MSKRPPAELPVSQGERDGNVPEQNDREERLENEEVGYETVRDGESFDKTTKYFKMSTGESSSAAREEVEGATAEENSSQHFYHILDHENGQVIEPVVYSRVDKRKKGASKQSADKDKDEVREVKSSGSTKFLLSLNADTKLYMCIYCLRRYHISIHKLIQIL